jgi:hypothetical protein
MYMESMFLQKVDLKRSQALIQEARALYLQYDISGIAPSLKYELSDMSGKILSHYYDKDAKKLSLSDVFNYKERMKEIAASYENLRLGGYGVDYQLIIQPSYLAYLQ